MKKDSKEDIKIARNHLLRFLFKMHEIKTKDEELFDEIIMDGKLFLDMINLMEILKNKYEE